MLFRLTERVPAIGRIWKNSLQNIQFPLNWPHEKVQPVHALTVAKAMITAANDMQGTHVIESDKIEELGNTQQQ